MYSVFVPRVSLTMFCFDDEFNLNKCKIEVLAISLRNDALDEEVNFIVAFRTENVNKEL